MYDAICKINSFDGYANTNVYTCQYNADDV